jgi:hypothetical protein
VPLQKACKVRRHGSSIVGNQNPAEAGGFDQHLGIRHTGHASELSALEIDCWLPTPETANDLLVEIRVRLKTRRHPVGFGVVRRAASNLA